MLLAVTRNRTAILAGFSRRAIRLAKTPNEVAALLAERKKRKRISEWRHHRSLVSGKRDATVSRIHELWADEESCLSRCPRCDQHLVGRWLDRGCDAEQGGEGGVPGFAAIEAEGEFVEVGFEMFAAATVINAERPGLEIGEAPVDGR